MKKISINMLSQATSVSGQGVGSAYVEQVNLVKTNTDIFDIQENSKSSKFDIYHVHTINPTYFLRMNKKHINICYVHFIPETLDGSIKLPKFAFKIFKKYVIRFYKKANEIVVVNNCFIEPLVKHGIKKENITYIPNFVSKDNFHPLSKEEINKLKNQYNIPVNKFVVLGCGQVQTRKGVKEFVEVAKRLPDIQFIWAGGFSFGAITDGHKELQDIMNNPPKNVKFLGIINRNKMNEIFNICDLLFMPSHSELFPMSILEASNVNKPTLLKNLDLYHDILFDKYYVGNNIEDYTNVIKKIINDKSYLESGINNAKYIADYYSKERVNNLWREYYTRIYNKYKDKRR